MAPLDGAGLPPKASSETVRAVLNAPKPNPNLTALIPTVLAACMSVVDAGGAWGVPEYSNWDKLGFADSDNWYPGSCCGEGSGVFNTVCESPERVGFP